MFLSACAYPRGGTDAYIGNRGDRPHSGRRDSRLRLRRPCERARHVPSASGRAPSARGRQPPCGGRSRGDVPRPGQGRCRARGHRPRIVLDGARTGSLPEGRRHCGEGVRLHPRHPDNRGQPLHSAHRDRPRPHRLQGSGAPLRFRRQHAGHSVRRREVQDLRRDAGHRHRQHAGQARQGSWDGILRRSRDREAGARGHEVSRAPVFGEGDGCRVLGHDNRGGGPQQERRSARGHSVLRPGDGVRHAHRGHRARHGPYREEGGPPRRRRSPERTPQGHGRGYGARARCRDVRPRQAVLQGQRRDDRVARCGDAFIGRQDDDP